MDSDAILARFLRERQILARNGVVRNRQAKGPRAAQGWLGRWEKNG